MNSLPVIEIKYVQSTYSCIYSHFSSTRHYVWPCVKSFLADKTSKHLGLEIGCGNGKNILYNTNLNIIGIDSCKEFISLNLRLNPSLNILQADCCDLPFNDNTFDYCLSIACFHHLSTSERRYIALYEMIRVMKKGGNGCITLWSVENQDKHKFTVGDNFVSWNNKYQRYYYVYNKSMINEYLNAVNDLITVKRVYNEKGNWIIIFNKL